nr:TRAM domain-containing protein [Saliphagus infecundisoli]
MVEVPEREVQIGDVEETGTYRVALLSTSSGPDDAAVETGGRGTVDEAGGGEERDGSGEEPPVEEGEVRTVEIEGVGEQGDGIARVERGFVVIVPDTEKGERVEVEIETVRPTVAFAEVTERLSYYD